MDTLLQEMGLRIMLRRKELDLSQEDVAEMTGLTTQTISTAERGVKALRPENIVKLCSVLEVSPNYLLLGENTRIPSDVFPTKIAKLTQKQRKYLESIVENYLAAVLPEHGEE